MVYPSRIKANKAINATIGGANSAQALADVSAELIDAANRLPPAGAGARYRQFGNLVGVLSHLVRWTSAVRSAELDADRFLRSAKLAARDISRETEGVWGCEALVRVTLAISSVTDVDAVPGIAKLLACVPLPLPIFAEAPNRQYAAPAESPGPKKPQVVVAFTSFQIDGVPFGNPHTIQHGMIHDLRIDLTVSDWPDEAKELILEPVSVEPSSTYDLPRFSFERPTGRTPHALTRTGRLVLQYPAALYARPLQFTYRSRFSPSIDGSQVLVQGHRQLQIQCFDLAREPQSGYVLADQRALEIRDEVRSLVGVPDGELNNFFVLLTAVGAIAGQSLQDNLFSQPYSESEFQKEMKRLLRQNPRIGSQLEEHPTAAAGITDLSFRGIRLELKVESDQPVNKEYALRFAQQTAQYVAGSDRRLGVLSILDCSHKTEAPGSVANDIFPITVQPPRGGSLPICIGVVIIRGNLSNPSSYSKKHAPIPAKKKRQRRLRG